MVENTYELVELFEEEPIKVLTVVDKKERN